MSHGKHKAEKLITARRLYLLATDGLTDIALAKALHIDRATAYRYRKELQATEVSEGRYTLEPSKEDVDLALAVLQRASRRDPHYSVGHVGRPIWQSETATVPAKACVQGGSSNPTDAVRFE